MNIFLIISSMTTAAPIVLPDAEDPEARPIAAALVNAQRASCECDNAGRPVIEYPEEEYEVLPDVHWPIDTTTRGTSCICPNPISETTTKANSPDGKPGNFF